MNNSHRQLPSSFSQQQQQQQLQQQQNIDSIIDSMTNDFKTFKNFWSNLPRKLCSYYSTSANCVANQTLRYVKFLNLKKLKRILFFPSFFSPLYIKKNRNSDEPNYRDRNNVEIINQQISTLRLISFNLNKAYNGLDVDFENNCMF